MPASLAFPKTLSNVLFLHVFTLLFSLSFLLRYSFLQSFPQVSALTQIVSKSFPQMMHFLVYTLLLSILFSSLSNICCITASGDQECYSYDSCYKFPFHDLPPSRFLFLIIRLATERAP